MKQLLLSSFFVILRSFCGLMDLHSQSVINTGEVFHETLKFSDPGNSVTALKIPSDSCMLLYRYRGNNWLMDTKDSIAQVEAIVQELQKNNFFKKLIVVCYSYNRDKFLNYSNKPDFQSGATYRVRNYFLNDRNPPRLLRSGKLVLLNRKGKVMSYSNFVAGFNYVHKEQTTRMIAKLLTEKNGKQVPLINATIVVESDKLPNKAVFTRTNKFGDFELTLPENIDEGTMKITSLDKSVESVIIANVQGVEQKRLSGKDGSFEYKLIEADFARLSDADLEEDLSLAFNTFMGSGDKEFRRSEFINYDLGMYKLEDSSKVILDKIANILTDHPSVALEVISHTDAQGDDKSNMELSEKRSLSVVSYMILIGVHKDRLSYTGKGETEIRNRCANGVECSPREHRYNRRTEFRFYKK
ncbi:MAG: OmpA family protein [bacterium]|nr:OmpA family protein [bacterium]